MNRLVQVALFASLAIAANCQFQPNLYHYRSGIVELFEWCWADVAKECERYLSPLKFGGVQVSPASEHATLPGRPWYERYQPISYRILTRSGNEKDFLDMTTRCSKVQVRVFVDVVMSYNSTQSRDDLISYMNKLISLGVGGFRIVNTNRMSVDEVNAVTSKLNVLNTRFDYADQVKPFINIDLNSANGVTAEGNYSSLGRVTQYKYAQDLGRFFRGSTPLKSLRLFGRPEAAGFLPSEKAMTFIDNRVTQSVDYSTFLRYKDARLYKMATAFQLAWPYGTPLIMSSTTSTALSKDRQCLRMELSNQSRSTETELAVLREFANTAGDRSRTWLCSATMPGARELRIGGTTAIIRSHSHAAISASLPSTANSTKT